MARISILMSTEQEGDFTFSTHWLWRRESRAEPGHGGGGWLQKGWGLVACSEILVSGRSPACVDQTASVSEMENRTWKRLSEKVTAKGTSRMMWAEQFTHMDVLTRLLVFGTLSTGAQLFSWKGHLRQRGKSSGSCTFPANFTSVFTCAHIHPSRVFSTELPSTTNIKISEEASDTCWAVRTGLSHNNKWKCQLGPGSRWAGVLKDQNHPFPRESCHQEKLNAEHPPVPLRLQRGAERTQRAQQECLSPTLTAPTPHSNCSMSLFTCVRVSSLPFVRGICWGIVSDEWMKDGLFFVPQPRFSGAHFGGFIEWRKKTKFPITCAARTP